MPEVATGLTEDGAAADPGDGFEAGLAAAVEKGGSSAAESERHANPAESTSQEIASALLSPDFGSKQVSDPIAVKESSPASSGEFAELGEQVLGALRSAGAELDAAHQELAESRSYDAGEEAIAEIDSAEIGTQVVGALGELRHRLDAGEVSPETYADVRATALEALAESFDLDPDDADQLEALLGPGLDSSTQHFVVQRQAEDAAEKIQALAPIVAERRVGEWQAVLTDFARSQGIESKEHLDYRVQNASAAFKQATGRDLAEVWSNPTTTPYEMAEVLAEYDAHVGAAVKIAHDQSFAQRVMDASPDFEDGLIIEGRAAPAKVLPAASAKRMNDVTQSFKTRARKQSPQSIKAQFGPESTDVRSGFTLNGKPVTRVSEIDGSKAQWERDERARRETNG